MRAALACALALACQGALAQGTLSLSHGVEALSGAAADWRETSLDLRYQAAPRQGYGLGLTRTERFGLRDSQLTAAGDWPLSPALTLSLDGALSNTHQVLARHALGANLQIALAPAWLLHVGGRHSRYNDAAVRQSLLMLEHYAGNAGFAAGWRAAHTLGTTAHSAEARASYYYGDKDRVSLVLAGGKEAARIGPDTRLASVRSATVVGRHALDGRWALSYSLGHTRQGDFYRRNGLHLGLLTTF